MLVGFFNKSGLGEPMDIDDIKRVVKIKRGESIGVGPYKARAGTDGFIYWRGTCVQPIFYCLSKGDLELKVLQASIKRNIAILKNTIGPSLY